jgi:hypothetical protein
MASFPMTPAAPRSLHTACLRGGSNDAPLAWAHKVATALEQPVIAIDEGAHGVTHAERWMWTWCANVARHSTEAMSCTFSG